MWHKHESKVFTLIAFSAIIVGVFGSQSRELSAIDPKAFFTPIDMKGYKIQNLGAPTSDSDAVPKSYATNATNLASGTVTTARLGSGTASSSTYLRGDQTWATVSASNTWQTMADGATVTLSWLNNSINAVTLGGNRTLVISGTPALGDVVRLRLKQDGTGTRTLTWPTSGVTFNWPLDEEPVLTTEAGRFDVIKLTCADATGGALVFDAVIEAMNCY